MPGIIRNSIIVFFAVFFSYKLHAQLTLSPYIDIGENNVSEGLYTNAALLGLHQIGLTRFEGGLQFDLKNNTSANFLTAFNFKVSHDLAIKEIPFELQGFILFNFPSDVIHELNWGLLASLERKHFEFKLGTEFRTYRIPKRAIDDYNIIGNNSIHENWNLIYRIQYNLKVPENKWNVGLAVTNIDHFLINQETNPMLFLKGKLKASPKLDLYAETWYKSTGVFNISSNYFGFFIRTGLIWNIN